MKKKLLHTLAAIVLGTPTVCSAQLVLERQSISCFALNVCGQDTSMCSTAGQVAFTTAGSGEGFLTQGFEQPRDWQALIATFECYLNTCTGLYEVHITSIAGCATGNTPTIYWNGIAGDSTQTGLSNMSTLMIETSADCNATYLLNFDAMTVTAVPCELIAYNLITPNNDGSNDVWIIETIALEANADNEVNLYNRWGALVWSADGYNNADKAWKGESTNGQALPDGTYYYEIIINGHTTAGYVELSR